MYTKERKNAEYVKYSVPIGEREAVHVDAQPDMENCSNGLAPQPNAAADGVRRMKVPVVQTIPLLAYPIKNSSAPNGVVMDLFGGSGSTLIACEQTDRICRTMELDPKYASVIVQRFIELTGSDEEVCVERAGVVKKYRQLDLRGK